MNAERTKRLAELEAECREVEKRIREFECEYEPWERDNSLGIRCAEQALDALSNEICNLLAEAAYEQECGQGV